MVLTRGFSGVDTWGEIVIPCNILLSARLFPGRPAGVEIVKLTGLASSPYIIVHEIACSSHLSSLDAVVLAGEARITWERRLVLSRSVLEEARFMPGDSVELKISRQRDEPWIEIHKATGRPLDDRAIIGTPPCRTYTRFHQAWNCSPIAVRLFSETKPWLKTSSSALDQVVTNL